MEMKEFAKLLNEAETAEDFMEILNNKELKKNFDVKVFEFSEKNEEALSDVKKNYEDDLNVDIDNIHDKLDHLADIDKMILRRVINDKMESAHAFAYIFSLIDSFVDAGKTFEMEDKVVDSVNAVLDFIADGIQRTDFDYRLRIERR